MSTTPKKRRNSRMVAMRYGDAHSDSEGSLRRCPATDCDIDFTTKLQCVCGEPTVTELYPT